MSRPKKFFPPIASVVGSTERHKCRRCHRVLPWEQFGRVGTAYAKIRGRLVIALHPYCFKCRDQLRGRWADHDLYTPELDRRIQVMISSSKSGAWARGIAYCIDRDDVLGLFIEQKGRCALSGEVMTYAESARGSSTDVSIDRIDSDGDYILGNVQLVCRVVNTMKMDQRQDQFVNWCKKIASHAEGREADLLRSVDGGDRLDDV